MVRWAAFVGVVSVLVTLLLALTRSSAAAVRGETPSNTTSERGSGVDDPVDRRDEVDADDGASDDGGPSDDEASGESTRVRDVFGDDGLSSPLGSDGLSSPLGSDGLPSPLPWRSDDEPADPLSGPGGTELTTLDESDYPDPPPDHARPDEPDDSTNPTLSTPDERAADSPTDADPVPDPSEAFPISGDAEYTDPDRPVGTSDTADSDTSTDRPALDDSESDDSPADDPLSDRPLGPDGDPLDRTGRADRWDGDGPAGHDRWTETDATPEDRWRGRSSDALDDVAGDSGAVEADDATAADGPETDAADPGVDDTATPGVATATSEPGVGLAPDAFDGPDAFDDPDPFAGETDGFDPQLPSERDGVRVGDRELSTTVLLANVVGSQLLFAGLLVAVTVWAAVPPAALGLGPVTLSQVGVGALLGVGLWIASESGGRLGRRVGVDPAEALRGALAPTTRREWWLLLGVVLPVVAVFEELLFRAALVGAFAAGASAAGLNLPVAVFVVGSSVAFGLAHSAQGRVGMAVTGLLGVVLAATFVLTESLVVVVVAHYVVNAAEFVVHEGPASRLPTE